ncbi:MAG: hypothetical protein HKN73_15720, partial [Gemmatimonadetes bacterium]|nr:hypothetical protein [Gemmatimonadota bacterium]
MNPIPPDAVSLNTEISLARLLEVKGEVLALEVMSGEDSLERTVANPDVSSPGLGLAGYTDGFPRGRIQVFGQTEMS